MSIGDTLPKTQQWFLQIFGLGFKLTVITGLAALVVNLLSSDTVARVLELVHQYVSYAYVAMVVVFFFLHLGYTLTLRGGYVFKITKVSGITLAAVGVCMIAVATVLSPDLSSSPMGLSVHVLGALLLPVLFQRHVIRAMGARGN